MGTLMLPLKPKSAGVVVMFEPILRFSCTQVRHHHHCQMEGRVNMGTSELYTEWNGPSAV